MKRKYLIPIVVVGWFAVTGFIYWLKHPDKSHMEVFLHTPKSLILNFK